MEVYVITVEKRSKTYGEDEDVGPVNHLLLWGFTPIPMAVADDPRRHLGIGNVLLLTVRIWWQISSGDHLVLICGSLVGQCGGQNDFIISLWLPSDSVASRGHPSDPEEPEDAC